MTEDMKELRRVFMNRRRLEKRIYIPLPDEEGRRELICINLKDVEVNFLYVYQQAFMDKLSYNVHHKSLINYIKKKMHLHYCESS